MRETGRRCCSSLLGLHPLSSRREWHTWQQTPSSLGLVAPCDPPSTPKPSARMRRPMAMREAAAQPVDLDLLDVPRASNLIATRSKRPMQSNLLLALASSARQLSPLAPPMVGTPSSSSPAISGFLSSKRFVTASGPPMMSPLFTGPSSPPDTTAAPTSSSAGPSVAPSASSPCQRIVRSAPIMAAGIREVAIGR